MKYSFSLIFLIIAYTSTAQNVIFNHLTKDDGLPSSTITSINQDKSGLIWIGTNEGLCSYDGYYFKKYLHSDTDTTSIQYNAISNIFIDNDKRMFIATRKGVALYNPLADNFKSVFSKDGMWIEKVTQDIYGNYYVMQKGWKTFIYNNDFELIGEFSNDTESKPWLKLLSPIDILCDSKGFTWVSTAQDGIYVYDVKNQKIAQHFKHNRQDINSIPSNKAKNLFEDKENELIWCSFDEGIAKISLENNNVERLIINGDLSYSSTLTMSNDGTIWGCRASQIIRYNPETYQLKSFYHNEFDVNSLHSGAYYQIFVDNSNNIWLGGINTNLNIITNNYKNFQHIKRIPGVASSMLHKSVNDLVVDKQGVLWIATDAGINRRHQNGWMEKFQFQKENENSLRANRVVSFYKNNNDELFAFGQINGVQKWNGEGNSFTSFGDKSDNTHLPSSRVKGMGQDSKGNWWLNAEGYGIIEYNPELDTFNVYGENAEDGWRQYMAKYHDFIYVDKEDNVYAGGAGLYIIKSNSEKVIQYNESQSNSITGKFVHTIYEDSEGLLWLGTASGLNSYDKESQEFKFFGEKHGLIGGVYGILDDNENNLWLSSTNGLYRFNKSDSVIKRFDKVDGIQDNEFTLGAAAKGGDGTLYFGGINGITAFNPVEIRTNPEAPIIQFTGFKLFNDYLAVDEKGILKQDIKYQDVVKLKHNQNTITIDYVGINFYQTQKNTYRYILEGLDKEWVIAKNNRQAQYTNISPGKYTFKVMASNSDGVWSKPISLQVVVRPPWWGTWAFRILFLFTIIYSVFAFFRYREKMAKQQKEYLEQKVKHAEELVAEKMAEVERQAEVLKRRDIEEHDMRYMNRGLAKFNEIIRKSKDSIENLTQSVIVELMKYAEVEQGVFYVLNDNDSNDRFLEIKGVYAGDKDKYLNKSFYINEGLVGSSFGELKTHSVQNFEGINAKIESGLGEAVPQHLVVIPIALDDMGEGVIEISSFNEIEAYKIDFIRKLGESLASTINGIKKNVQIEQMLIKNQEDTEELRAQEEEMRQNMEEMQATQEEMTRNKAELERVLEKYTAHEQKL